MNAGRGTRRSAARRPGSRRLTAAIWLVLLGCAVAGSVFAIDGLAPAPPAQAPSASQAPSEGPARSEGPAPAAPGAAPAAAGTAAAALEALPEKGRAPKTGYDRTSEFGAAWADVDRNGCRTRDDILQRDLDGAVLDGGGCKVLSGMLADPYTGRTIEFVRGEQTSALVQIDHIVALSDAWQKGAQQISRERRVALANDPLNLVAVDGAANSAKGDGDAATWLPQNRGFRCEYVARQISVKTAYGLWVTPAEKTAMRGVLETCPEQPALASPLAGSAP